MSALTIFMQIKHGFQSPSRTGRKVKLRVFRPCFVVELSWNSVERRLLASAFEKVSHRIRGSLLTTIRLTRDALAFLKPRRPTNEACFATHPTKVSNPNSNISNINAKCEWMNKNKRRFLTRLATNRFYPASANRIIVIYVTRVWSAALFNEWKAQHERSESRG